jgi:hypothetical protein
MWVRIPPVPARPGADPLDLRGFGETASETEYGPAMDTRTIAIAALVLVIAIVVIVFVL